MIRVRTTSKTSDMIQPIEAQYAPAARAPDYVASPKPDAWCSSFVNHIRLKALQCRSAARADLFRACAVLSSRPETARDAYAEALVRCLFEATGRLAILHRPGALEFSFDEAWLMRLAIAAKSGDDDSFGFLIRSRVRSYAQRNMSFLLRSLVARLD